MNSKESFYANTFPDDSQIKRIGIGIDSVLEFAHFMSPVS